MEPYYYTKYDKDDKDFSYWNKDDYCPKNNSDANLCKTINEY